MSRIFSVQLRSEKVPENGPFLDLPASPYELLDALEKLRVKAEAPVHWEIVDYCVPSFNTLIPEEAGNLYELNALARKLSELDHPQQLAYRGLLSMEYTKGCQLIPIPRLIDFAYGTHCCQVSPDIRSDRQFGYDSVAKGNVPGIRGLSAEQRKLLDCALVGRQRREAEGGVFVSVNFSEPLGYVRQTAPIERTLLDLTLKKPDYSILLSVYGKWDPNTGRRKSALLELPLEEDALNAVLAEYDGMGSCDDVWNRIAWDGLDCVVPRLTGMIFDFGSDNSYSESATRRLNNLAKNLAVMGPEDLTAYKALLEAMDCCSLDAAVRLLDTLGDYSLSRQISSPAGIAEERLRKAVRGQGAEALISRVDMERYGEALMEESGGELTSYGLLTRKDGQPVADFKEQTGQRSESPYLHLY